jgi:hypothetical protein
MSRMTCLALAVLMVSGCCAVRDPAVAPTGAPPVLDKTAALDLAVRADAAVAAAMAGLDPAGLSSAFRGPALQVLRDQVERLRERSIRLEERGAVRTLDTWDARRREVVIQVESQVRLVSPDQVDPTWSNTVRRWWAQAAYIGGTWWVIDQRNLGPRTEWP